MAVLPDYYAILQVHTGATKEVIDAAYRKLATKYHPDVNTSLDAASRMKQLNEAYEVLSDPARRAAYDRSRGIASAEGAPSVRSWRRVIVTIGLVLLIIIAVRLGIRVAVILLVFAAVMWLLAKIGK